MASLVVLVALRAAMSAASGRATSTADPAAAVAGAQTTNTPAPSIEATPIAVAPGIPSRRCSRAPSRSDSTGGC